MIRTALCALKFETKKRVANLHLQNFACLFTLTISAHVSAPLPRSTLRFTRKTSVRRYLSYPELLRCYYFFLAIPSNGHNKYIHRTLFLSAQVYYFLLLVVFPYNSITPVNIVFFFFSSFSNQESPCTRATAPFLMGTHGGFCGITQTS